MQGERGESSSSYDREKREERERERGRGEENDTLQAKTHPQKLMRMAIIQTTRKPPLATGVVTAQVEIQFLGNDLINSTYM